MTGVMELTGDPGTLPTKTGYSAVDNSAGAFAALGLLAKLHSGEGGQVDIAMYDVMLSQLNYLASSRSEERRVGKECVRTCRSRWSPDHEKKKKKNSQSAHHSQQA